MLDLMVLAPESEEPLFQQIRRHIAEGIRRGDIPTGARLPSTRALARRLGVCRLTVINAYAELAADVLVEPSHGSGTFVRKESP